MKALYSSEGKRSGANVVGTLCFSVSFRIMWLQYPEYPLIDFFYTLYNMILWWVGSITSLKSQSGSSSSVSKGKDLCSGGCGLGLVTKSMLVCVCFEFWRSWQSSLVNSVNHVNNIIRSQGRKKTSIVIQRGNAASIVGSFPFWTSLEKVYNL